MANKPFTEKEKDFIRENFHAMTLRDLAKALGRSEGGVKTWTIKLGLRRGTRFDWTPERLAVFEEMYPNHSAKEIAEVLGTSDYVIYARSRHSTVRKSPEYLKALNKRMGENLQKGGFGTRFVKGQPSWNAGKKIGSFGRSKETQFKKGQNPHNALRVGDEVCPDGYWKVKIAEPNKWEFKHRLLWKKAHGEIPKGQCVVFKDGNPLNCVIENLECITRKELYMRNSIHALPPEIKEIKYALGGLQRAINKKEKENAEK